MSPPGMGKNRTGSTNGRRSPGRANQWRQRDVVSNGLLRVPLSRPFHHSSGGVPRMRSGPVFQPPARGDAWDVPRGGNGEIHQRHSRPTRRMPRLPSGGTQHLRTADRCLEPAKPAQPGPVARLGTPSGRVACGGFGRPARFWRGGLRTMGRGAVSSCVTVPVPGSRARAGRMPGPPRRSELHSAKVCARGVEAPLCVRRPFPVAYAGVTAASTSWKVALSTSPVSSSTSMWSSTVWLAWRA
ncbi:hypothetical protein QFZ82_000610 [Streptomyces sp. V4I23]|nr:hypothetical protein [Streptomyces sp. V4I23]